MKGALGIIALCLSVSPSVGMERQDGVTKDRPLGPFIRDGYNVVTPRWIQRPHKRAKNRKRGGR